MSLITDNFLEAIDIIVDKKISEAAYDQAVVAEVVSVIDEDKGIYQVRYQDSFIEATSIGDVKYFYGQQVYVLKPQNDENQEHLILGATSNSKNQFNVDNIIGNSVMKGFDYILNITNDADEVKTVLYDYNQPQSAAFVTALDQGVLSEYVSRASALWISAHFTATVADNDPQTGDYGFEIEVQFEDTVETYVFNKAQLKDNRFTFKVPTKKSALFAIDGQQFRRINKITWFVKGVKAGARIGFTNLQIYGYNEEQGYNEVGATLSLKAPQGTTFESIDGTTTTLPIQTRLKINNQYISDTSMIYTFYAETPWSESGWTEIYDQGDSNNPDRTLSSEDFTSYYQTLKCVAQRGSEVYSEQLLLQNTIIGSGWITIVRNNDNALCSLTAKLVDENGNIIDQALEGRCSWMITDAEGVISKISTSSDTVEINPNELNGDCTVSVGVQSIGAVARYSIILAKERLIKDAAHYFARYEKDTEIPQDIPWVMTKELLGNIAGYYLWEKVVYTYTDDSTYTSDPTVSGVSTSVALYTYDKNLREPWTNEELQLNKDGWEITPLSPTAENPEVYVTYGVKVNGDYLVNQDWSDPVLFARYSIDGSTHIYRSAYQKVKYQAVLDKPTVNWNELPTIEGDAGKWYAIPVDLNKQYPFVYQCAQEEIQTKEQITYSDWSAPFLDRHWGEDYIYGYGYDASATLPDVNEDGNVQWNKYWSSADLSIDEKNPIVYRITAIVEGDILQPLDGGNGGASQDMYWTDPVVYKNYSTAVKLESVQYGISSSGNFTGEHGDQPPTDIEKWDDIYPDLNDNEDIKGKYIWTKLIYSDKSVRYETVYIAKDGIDGDPGGDGNPARDLTLKASSYVAKKLVDENGNVIYDPPAITFTAVAQNINYTGNVWTVNGAPQDDIDDVFELFINTDLFKDDQFTVSVAPSVNGDVDVELAALLTDSATIIQLEDGVKGEDGKDGENVFKVSCTNPVMLFNDTTSEETATFSVYYGLTTVPFGATTKDIPMYWTLALSSNDVDDGNFVSIDGQSVTITESDNDDDYVFNINVYSDKGEILYSENFIIQARIVSSVQDFGLETTTIAVKENKDGTITPDTITITPKPKNIEIDTYTWSDGVESKSETNNGARTFETDKITYPFEITCECVYNDKTFSDTVKVIKVKDGEDSFNINLTNGTMTFNKKDTDAQESTYVYAWHGLDQLAYGQGGAGSGYTFTIQVHDNNASVADEGRIIITNPRVQGDITGIAQFYKDGQHLSDKNVTFTIHVTIVEDGKARDDITLKVNTLTVKRLIDPPDVIYEPNTIIPEVILSGNLVGNQVTISPAPNDKGEISIHDIIANGNNSGTITVTTFEGEVKYTDEVTIYALQDGEGAFAVVVDNPVMVFNKSDTDDVPETANVQVFMGTKEIDFVIQHQYDEDGNPIKSVTIHRGDLSEDYKTTFDYTIFAFPEGEGEDKPVVTLHFAISATLVNDGKDAKGIDLYSTAYVVKKKTDDKGNVTYDPEQITLTARTNGFENPTIIWDGAVRGTGNTQDLQASTIFNSTTSVEVRAEVEGAPDYYDITKITLIEDGAKGDNGKDAISVINTNPSMQFNEKEEGASKTTTIEVWQGLTQLKIESISNGTVSANGLSATITVQKPSSAGTQSYTVTAKDTEGNTITVPVDISITFVKDGKSSTIKSYYFGPTTIDSINNIPSDANWEEDDLSGEATEETPYVYRKDVTVEDGIETNKFIIVAHFRFAKGDKGDTGNTIKTSVMRAYWGTTDIGEDTPKKPNGNTLGSWTAEYSAVYEYPYVYITECEVVFTYNPEGKQIGNAEYKTWSNAALYKVNGSDANVNLVNTFNALTQNGTQQGIYYTDDQDQPIKGALTENSKVKDLFINASMIKTGYLDANTLLAGEIRVGDKFYVKLDKDINGNTQTSDIKLAGFFVNNSQIYSNTRIGQTAWDSTEKGICIDSNKGIRLGEDNAFEVTSEGALTATKASITGEIKATSGWFGSETSGVEINSNGIYKSAIFQLGADDKGNNISSIGGLNITENGLEYQSNGSSVIIKTYDTGNQSSTIISDTAEFNTAIFGDKTSSASKWRFTRTADGNAFYLEHDDGLQFSGEGLYHSDGADGQRYIKWIDLLAIATGGAATTIDKVAGLQQELNNRYTKAEILTINENGKKSGVLADYYTITEANSQINASINASVTPEIKKLQQADTDTNNKFQNYSTTAEMNAAIENAIKTVDLSNYYTKSETYKKSEIETLIQSSVGYVLTNAVIV